MVPVDTTSLNCLPNEILAQIYKLCDADTTWKMYQTSRRLQSLYMDILYEPRKKDIKMTINENFSRIEIGRIAMKISPYFYPTEFTTPSFDPIPLRGFLRKTLVADQWKKDEPDDRRLRTVLIKEDDPDKTYEHLVTFINEEFGGYLKTLEFRHCSFNRNTSTYLETLDVGHLYLERVLFFWNDPDLARFFQPRNFAEVSIIEVLFKDNMQVLLEEILKRNITLNVFQGSENWLSSFFQRILNRKDHSLPRRLCVRKEIVVSADRVIEALKEWFEGGSQAIDFWCFAVDDHEKIVKFLSTCVCLFTIGNGKVFFNKNGDNIHATPDLMRFSKLEALSRIEGIEMYRLGILTTNCK